jgi:hypothetical protein
MTKIKLQKVSIPKEQLSGYSASMQKVIEKEMSWSLNLKFSRIVRAIQPILKEYDEDRKTIVETFEVDENATPKEKRAANREAQKALDVVDEETVEVYEVLVSDLKKIFDKATPKLAIGFGDALVFDIDPDVESEPAQSNEVKEN